MDNLAKRELIAGHQFFKNNIWNTDNTTDGANNPSSASIFN